MRHLKSYKLFESYTLRLTYGAEMISECESIMADISDILLELKDSGLWIKIDYTPLTVALQSNNPKILVTISGDVDNIEKMKQEIEDSMQRIADYLSNLDWNVEDYKTTERGGRKIIEMRIKKSDI